jgi:hypothetical protein
MVKTVPFNPCITFRWGTLHPAGVATGFAAKRGGIPWLKDEPHSPSYMCGPDTLIFSLYFLV